MEALSGMAIFAAVVEAEGFSPAARRLGLSKSTVSKQISRLESHLNVRLLHRTTRKLSLTDAGELYYRHAVKALDEARAAEDAVTLMRGHPRGVLRISTPMSFGLLHISPVISKFIQQHPELRLDIVMEDRITDLVEGGFDLAIRVGKLAPDSNLVARQLATCSFYLCAAPAYLDRRGIPNEPADLLKHDCLLFSHAPKINEWQFHGVDGPVTVKVAGSLQANSGLVLREAALAGLGLVRMPAAAIGPDLQAGRLRRVLPNYSIQALTVYAVFPEGRHIPAKSRLFIDFLTHHWGTPAYWEIDR